MATSAVSCSSIWSIAISLAAREPIRPVTVTRHPALAQTGWSSVVTTCRAVITKPRSLRTKPEPSSVTISPVSFASNVARITTVEGETRW